MPTDRLWRVERVTAQDTYALRRQVLRPHQSLTQVGFPGDDDPDAGHFAAYPATDPPGAAAGAGPQEGGDAHEVVGVVTVVRQRPAAPASGNPETWWRLRGMATAQRHRGRGAGSALLSVAVAHVAAHDGEVLWCYARMSAVGFYRTVGFVTTGDPWDEPALGPHVAMWRTVPRPPG